MKELVDVWKVYPESYGNPLICPSLEDALESLKYEMESADFNEPWILEKGQMTQEEYDALPEHSGW
jgi:hypothetical protein